MDERSQPDPRLMLLSRHHCLLYRPARMKSLPFNLNRRISRRKLLKNIGFAPLLLRPAPLFGGLRLFAPTLLDPTNSLAAFSVARQSLVPRIILRNLPLADVLKLVKPGSDRYVTELFAFEIESVFQAMERSPEALAARPLDTGRVL